MVICHRRRLYMMYLRCFEMGTPDLHDSGSTDHALPVRIVDTASERQQVNINNSNADGAMDYNWNIAETKRSRRCQRNMRKMKKNMIITNTWQPAYMATHTQV